jgi:hypothetical protein
LTGKGYGREKVVKTACINSQSAGQLGPPFAERARVHQRLPLWKSGLVDA